jgi:diguanylate cyclase (GGDEF)-like protein/PAS domain S-box-containing protein
MFDRFDLYVPLIYLLAAIPYAGLGWYAWRRKHKGGVAPFAWVMTGCFIWTFAYGVEISIRSLPLKFFLVGVQYLGVIIIPVFLFIFVFEFIGKSRLLTPVVRFVLWIIPVASLLLAWTNPHHNLMWSGVRAYEAHGLLLLDFQYETFFWIFASYAYGLLVVGCTLLGMEMIQRPGMYRVQFGFVIAGILIPLAGNAVYLSENSPVPNLDITPLFFLPTAAALSWAILHYRLLEFPPFEHLTVLQNMKDGVILLDPGQRILYVNPAAEQLIRHGEDEAVGQLFDEVAGSLAKKLSLHLGGGEARAEITLEENGQAGVYEVSVSPVRYRDESAQSVPNTLITIDNITKRKEAERQLSRREAVMSAINFAAEHFLKETRWEHHVPAVLERLGRAANVSRVHVVMNYTDGSGVFHSSLCYEWTASHIAPQIDNPALRHAPLRKSGFGRWEDTLLQGIPIHGLVQNFPERERKVLQRLGSVSVAVVPIFVDNQWWGYLLFDECEREREWTSMELEAFYAAANIFGSAETRSRTEQKLLRRRNALDLLRGIVETALKADTIEEMGQVVVDRLAELIHADGCFLTLWDETIGRTIPLAAHGPLKDTYKSLAIQPGERTFTESALQAGHTLVVEDTEKTTFVEKRIVQAFPAKSALVLPLIAAQKKLGAVILAFNDPHRFSAEEISICEQAASLIALALEKFQAVEEAKQRAAASEQLRKASLAVAERLEMEQTVSKILEHLNEIVPYDSASVQLLEGDELVVVGGRGFMELKAVIGLRFSIRDEANQQLMETGKPVYIAETDYHSDFHVPPHNHIRSWLGVPLIVQDRIIGVLTVDSSEPHHFVEEDIKTASEFGNQVAAALENARLFEETQIQAITDPLTGIYNRRGLFQFGESEFNRARRFRRPFSAMMFDIDRFKRVNDHHGHAVGDQILHQLALRVRKSSRGIDLFGRYGGEEFTMLLPETGIVSAQRAAERLRTSIMDQPFDTDAGSLRITVSIGVAEMQKQDTLQSLIERADAALYRAKGAGRNRVMTDDGTQP